VLDILIALLIAAFVTAAFAGLTAYFVLKKNKMC
jgi:hypothetical protein